MESRLRVSGHPIQPMLVTLPLGLFGCATVFDLAGVAGGLSLLGVVGYWTAVAALVAAALGATAGLVDLWDIPGGATRRTATTFNLFNAAMAALFVIVCLIRAGSPAHPATGGLVAVEVLALAVGAVNVRLAAKLVRRFDEARGEATTFDALGAGPLGATPGSHPAEERFGRVGPR